MSLIRLSPLLLVLAATACKQEEEVKPAPATAAVAKAPPPAPTPAAPAPAATPDANADSIVVEAAHNPPKEGDPVQVSFKKFTVTEAKVADPANLEGSTATVEIDLASVSSGIEKRDAHLQSGDYMNVSANPKAVIKVSDVKKAGGADKYTATADVNFHGSSLKVPVSFEVVEKRPDGVRIKGEHKFKRADFKVGKTEGDPTAEDLTIKLALTIPKQ